LFEIDALRYRSAHPMALGACPAIRAGLATQGFLTTAAHGAAPDNPESKTMAFVNEYIPKEDLEKYNFAELDKRIKKGGETARAG
jgi:hypothetical protein